MRISVGVMLLVFAPYVGGCDPDTTPVPSTKTDAGGGGAAGFGGEGGTGNGGTGASGMGGESGMGGSAGSFDDAGPDDAGPDDAGEDVVQESGTDAIPDGPSCCPTDFSFSYAGASSVEIRGTPDPMSWEDGNGISMTAQGGTWVAQVCLNVSREYRYKFVVNGTDWMHDDTQPKVDDGQGGFNNVIGPLLICE